MFSLSAAYSPSLGGKVEQMVSQQEQAKCGPT